jgi:hypothetical protein
MASVQNNGSARAEMTVDVKPHHWDARLWLVSVGSFKYLAETAREAIIVAANLRAWLSVPRADTSHLALWNVATTLLSPLAICAASRRAVASATCCMRRQNDRTAQAGS